MTKPQHSFYNRLKKEPMLKSSEYSRPLELESFMQRIFINLNINYFQPFEH
jgi:hypothetical protein